MPKESDWILYAPYSDKSLIRNALVYDTARKLGGYASRHQFVELTLNDQYEGVYLLLEKVKRDKNRVDISKLKDDISGGYILELQKTPEETDDAQFFTSDFVKRSFFYNYPKANDISEEEKNYISSYIKDFETALYAEDPASQSPNYTEFINTESFIDYILISEVFKNKDYFIGSTFMYKDKNAKLHLGPLWDFNLSLGNVDTSFDELKETGAPEGFLTDVKSSWADQLFKDPEFTNAYNARYKALRQDLLSTETLLQNIERFNNEISSAQERNFKRWPILGTYIWPNRFIGETHDEEISYLKDWLSQRLEWLDQNIDNRPK